MSSRLGVALLTNDNPMLVAYLLDLLRDAADSVIVGVDSRRDPATLWPIVSRADSSVRIQIDGPGDINPAKWWLARQLDTEWVLFIDSDEVPSTDLLSWLPTFDRECPLTQGVSFMRRWVWPDGDSYLVDDPWRDDPQLRLVRMHSSTVRCGRGIHEPLLVAGAQRVQSEPLYHLDLLMKTVNTRRAKVAGYRGDALAPQMHVGELDFNAAFYLPEEHTEPLDVSAIPPQDLILVRDALASSLSDVPASTSIDDLQLITRDAFTGSVGPVPSCAFAVLDAPTHLSRGVAHRIPVKITNTGGAVLWPHIGVAGVALGFDVTCDGVPVVVEGRSPLQVPLAPSDSTVLFAPLPVCDGDRVHVSLGVVDERSAWLTDRLSFELPVTAR